MEQGGDRAVAGGGISGVEAGAGAGVIGRDVECVACGYNLRGLRGDGVCPECGGGIAASLVDLRSERAQAGWRRTLRRGVMAGAVEYVILMALVPLARVVDVEAVTGWMMGAMGVSALLGGWWVARPEPGRRQGGLGAAVRGMAVVVGVGGYGLMEVMEAGWRQDWYRAAAVGFLVANGVKTGLQMGVLVGVTGRGSSRRLARVGRWMVGVGPGVWVGMLGEQFVVGRVWVDWALVAGVALACAGVVMYSGWLYDVLRGRREAVA